MKKILVNLSMLLIALFMVGCAGLGDYSIELINGYKVVRTSAEVKIIVNTNNGNDIVAPPGERWDEGEYLVQVGHDAQRYIVAKTNIDLYYIIDTKIIEKEVVYGPLLESEFNKKKEELGVLSSVQLKELDEYEQNQDDLTRLLQSKWKLSYEDALEISENEFMNIRVGKHINENRVINIEVSLIYFFVLL